ncbi:MAG: ribosome silencing factor [Gammaproteobacteria bacterium]|nr:MAG: ribosome silencing factor [Gammaproteobacteria bacterium]
MNDSSEVLTTIVRDAIEDMKGKDITELDVRALTDIADAMFIVTGTSQRHVKSISDQVVEKAKEAGFRPVGVEGELQAEWILVDLGDVIVHVMQQEIRDYYRLERLWCIDEGDQSAVLGDES